MTSNNNLQIHNQDEIWDSVSIVLVEPSKPQNLGSIARVIMNFGFSNFIIINPIVNLADPEIEIVARHACTIINQAKLGFSLQEVRDQFDFIIGTTSRTGSDYNLRRIAVSPDDLLTGNFPTNNIAIVFGREQHGLTNEEISLCDLVVTIPTQSSYPVMNVSHAVAIILYFLSRKIQSSNQNDSYKEPKYRPASHIERQKLEYYFDQVIKSVGYHPEKQHVALQSFSNILSRGYVTGRELTTLMGVFKWIQLNLEDKSSRDKLSS